MSKRTIGVIVLVAGLLLVILSITADAVGIGAEAGFGLKQTVGVIVGILVATAAAWWTWKKPRIEH